MFCQELHCHPTSIARGRPPRSIVSLRWRLPLAVSPEGVAIPGSSAGRGRKTFTKKIRQCIKFWHFFTGRDEVLQRTFGHEARCEVHVGTLVSQDTLAKHVISSYHQEAVFLIHSENLPRKCIPGSIWRTCNSGKPMSSAPRRTKIKQQGLNFAKKAAFGSAFCTSRFSLRAFDPCEEITLIIANTITLRMLSLGCRVPIHFFDLLLDLRSCRAQKDVKRESRRVRGHCQHWVCKIDALLGISGHCSAHEVIFPLFCK